MVRKLEAVILAAGRSRRFRMNTPKIIQEVCGRPLVYYLIKQLKKKRYISKVILVLGYKAEAIRKDLEKYFGDLQFVCQKPLNGSARAVLAAKDKVAINSSDILVLYGDTLLLDDKIVDRLYRYHIKENNDATFISCYTDTPRDLGRVILSERGQFVAIKENKDLTRREKHISDINAGIYIFNKRVLFKTLPQVRKDTRKNEYFLTDVLGIMKKEGLKIGVLQLKSCRDIFLINRQKELVEAESLLRRKTLDKLIEKGVRIIDPHSTFIYPEVNIGHDTVIYPFTFIENNVKIGKYCRIGPFAHIRAFTQIKDKTEVGNFSEIVRSSLGREVKMKHFSYIGDTHVGDKVNVGAGSVIANYDGKRKHKSYIGKSAFIGSNSTLVAPVKVGKSSITGAGSVVRKKVPPYTVVVGVPAKILRRKK